MLHCLVFWKLGNLETRVNFRIEFAMFEKSNQKKTAQREKRLGSQCYAMQVHDDNRRRLRRQR